MRWICSALLCVSAALPAVDLTVHDDRLSVELVAEHPQVLTPTGIAADERGRVWVIENNTHFRPKNYAGAATDRILIFEDFDQAGKARKSTVFAEGFQDGMSLAIAANGDVYFATRSLVMLLRDKDGDSKCDEQKTLIKLETTCTYPHNALCGFAFGADGNIYFALGENLGAAYKLIGSDGKELSGGGEGGSHYYCKPDGSGMTRIAIGLWNTYHQAFDAFGRLFAVDNDPGAGEHCRLVHIVQGGDYGFRKRPGWDLSHPFNAWYGELPGTLPPVCTTSEAPTGIVIYEHNGLPADYLGKVLVCSWGDHTLESFTLEPRGASYGAAGGRGKVLISGPHDFRPSGMCLAHDGSLLIADWVSHSYNVHGQGRIWRVKAKATVDEPKADLFNVHRFSRGFADDGLRPSAVSALTDIAKLQELLFEQRKEIRNAAHETLAKRSKDGFKALKRTIDTEGNARARVHALWGAYHLPEKDAAELIARGMNDKDAAVRMAAAECARQLRTTQRDKDLKKLAEKDESPGVRMAATAGLQAPDNARLLLALLASDDVYLNSAGISYGQSLGSDKLSVLSTGATTRQKLGIIMALRRINDAAAKASIPELLKHQEPAIRRAVLHWIGEDGLTEFADELDVSLDGVVTEDVFRAYLTTQELLGKLDKNKRDELILKLALDETRSMFLRSVAMRVADPKLNAVNVKQIASLAMPDAPAAERMLEPFFSAVVATALEDLIKLLVSRGENIATATKDNQYAPLFVEAIRYLAQRTDDDSQAALRAIMPHWSAILTTWEKDPRFNIDDNDVLSLFINIVELPQLEALVGLNRSANADSTQQLLLQLLQKPSAALKFEALRSLRGCTNAKVADNLKGFGAELANLPEASRSALAEQLAFTLKSMQQPVPPEVEKLLPKRPQTADEWKKTAGEQGDAAAGRRLFHHPRGAQCFVCHTVNGRGGKVGPDLSTIGKTMPVEKLVEAIVEPGKDVAPNYLQFAVTMKKGDLITGVFTNGAAGRMTFADSQGKEHHVYEPDIVSRRPLAGSIMPDNLVDSLTVQEFRDLIAFLTSLGK